MVSKVARESTVIYDEFTANRNPLLKGFKPEPSEEIEVNHPRHYGGETNPFEAIKVIEAWGLGFHLGNTLKYICRYTFRGKVEDLKKARWYLDRKIAALETANK